MTILPGGCCYGNASATAMIAHSCLINWFFNAPWYVRTLQVHWIWENNGFSSASPFFWPSLVSLVISPQLFPHVLWSALMFLTEWGRIQLGYLKCKRIFFFFPHCLLWAAAAAHTESNAMWILCLFKAALLQNYSVVHFYSGNLLGPIMIREPSLHLWTSTRVYQDLICSGLLNLIFLALC